jgi:hypothetical protein
MKLLLAIGLLMFFCGNLYAQTSAADSLKAYIKSEGYVPITKKARLPKAITPYYSMLMDTISHHPAMKEWYIKLSSFKNDSDYVSFYLYPLSAIADSKRFENSRKAFIKNYDTNTVKLKDFFKDTVPVKNLPPDIVDKIQIIDDYSGSDGEVCVSISKKTHIVRMFSYQ